MNPESDPPRGDNPIDAHVLPWFLSAIQRVISDDYKHVDVNTLAQDGTPIESGKAVENGVRSGEWIYAATAHVALGFDIFIEVNGVDHAGNETKLTETRQSARTASSRMTNAEDA